MSSSASSGWFSGSGASRRTVSRASVAGPVARNSSGVPRSMATSREPDWRPGFSAAMCSPRIPTSGTGGPANRAAPPATRKVSPKKA